MKNIRRGVFETNSSSSHSISISENTTGMYSTIEPDDFGNIILVGGKFGWEWEKFNDPLTKANYCMVDRVGNQASMEMLIEVIKEHTGALHVEVLSHEHSWDSYIDHESHGTASKAFASKETLKEFIFNPESWLFTGNDNGDAPPNFYDVDPNIQYKFELFLDGVDKTFKFQSKPSNSELIQAFVHLADGHPACSPYIYGGDGEIASFNDAQYNYRYNSWTEDSINSNNFLDQNYIEVFDIDNYCGDGEWKEVILNTQRINFHLKDL